MNTLHHKVIAISGAASGIGLALASQCLAKGAKVAMADINHQALAECLSTATPSQLLKTVVDVSNATSVSRWADDVYQHFGTIDMVVNNAGVSLSRNIANMSLDELKWVMNINFGGVVNGVNAFLPYLKQQPQAHIVNVASLFGIVAVPSQAAYNASKFAVRGYTEALRQELQGSSVKVTCICPGGVKTNIVRNGKHFDALDGSNTSNPALVKTFDKIAGTSAEKAASLIIKGILRNKRRVLIGSDAVLLDLLQRLFPGHYDSITLPIAKLGLRLMSLRGKPSEAETL